MNVASLVDLQDIGIDIEKEMAIVIQPSFRDTVQYLVFPNKETEPTGTSYVRFVDHKGVEQLYYDADEWASEGRQAGEEVMGSILGAIIGGAHRNHPSLKD